MRFAPVIILCAALATACPAAVVRTLDGKTYEGDARFDTGQLLVQVRRGPAVRLNLADVLEATFRDPDPPPATRQPPAAPGGLPGGWRAQDVGEVGSAGSARCLNGTYYLKGAGRDVGRKADAFQFAGAQVFGEAQVTARLADLQHVARYAKAGITIRASTDLDPAGAHVSLFLEPSTGIGLLWRREAGGETTRGPFVAQQDAPPVWLRLTRRADLVTAYTSADGVTWRPHGEPIPLPTPQRAAGWGGLFVCSHDPPGPAAATFDNVTVRNGLPRDDPAAAPRPGNAPVSRAVVLRGGTVLANATILRATDGTVQFNRADGKQLTLPADAVARLILAPVAAQVLAGIPEHAAGVLLAKGDFVEGEFQGYEGGRVRLSSVLFGLKQFAAGSEAVAIVLRDVDPPRAPWVVRTQDGAVYMARTASIDRDQLVVDDEAAGTVKLSTHYLADLKPGGGRLQRLTDLSPVRADGAWRLASGAGELSFAGAAPAERGILLPAGASVDYACPGTQKMLLCRVGIPAGVLPTVSLRYAVFADGREVYRSPPRTSLDEPAALLLNVGGAKTLTFRAEPGGADSLGGAVVWGDATLVN